MGRFSAILLPPKRRLQDLQEQITLLQGQLRAGRGITVLTVCRCGHQECGSPPPAELPEDCLVIELGCGHAIPAAPPVEETHHRSRAELSRPASTTGRGIGPERQKRLLKTIRLL